MEFQGFERKFGNALLPDLIYRYGSIKEFVNLTKSKAIELSYDLFLQYAENLKAVKFNNYPKQFWISYSKKDFSSRQSEQICLLTDLLDGIKDLDLGKYHFSIYELDNEKNKKYINSMKVLCDKNYTFLSSLKDVLNDDLRNWKEIGWKVRLENSVFDLKSIQEIHSCLNNTVIENIDLLTFNEVFNTIDPDNKKIKYLDGKKVLLCILLNKISLSIVDEKKRKRWIEYILNQFDIQQSLFNKKNSEKQNTDKDMNNLISLFYRIDLKEL